MEAQFLDTNIILRYLTKDDPDQATRARRLFQEVQAGTLILVTTEAVIIEAVQVLSSKALYNLPRTDIKTHLANIISLGSLKLANKRTYLRALDLYASSNIDFVDALIVAHIERTKISTVVSFDKDFDRIPGVNRREP